MIHCNVHFTTEVEKGTKGRGWGGYCDGSLAVRRKVYWSLPGLLSYGPWPWSIIYMIELVARCAPLAELPCNVALQLSPLHDLCAHKPCTHLRNWYMKGILRPRAVASLKTSRQQNRVDSGSFLAVTFARVIFWGSPFLPARTSPLHFHRSRT
jgi:hypothetical protein